MQQLRSIQVLRALAVCVVVSAHAYAWGVARVGVNSGHRMGAAADTFFVISGFVMALIPKRPTFLYDRFWRIYPLWLIAVTPWIIISHPDWPGLATSLTLWPAWGRMVMPVLPVGWTLCFDVVYYIAVAVSMRAGVKPVLAIYGVMFVCSVLSAAPVFDFLGNPMFFECLMGAALTKLPRDARLGLPLLLSAILLLSIAPGWVIDPMLAMRSPASAWRVLYFGVPATLAVYGCLCLEKSFQHRVWNGPVFLGTASYSIYLFHLIVIHELNLPWVVELPVAVAAGIAAWWLLEEPIRKLKPKWGRRPRPLVPAE